MIVVSNSSPLIALTQIGRFDLLGRLHALVLIPPAVAREIEPTVPQLRAERLVLDERPARRLAASLGLSVIGTIGLLSAAKDQGLMIKIKAELDRLLAVRFFMDEELHNRILVQAGE